MSRCSQRTFTIWGIAGSLIMGLAMAIPALAQQPAGPPPQREPLLTPEDRAAMAQVYWHRVQVTLGLNDVQVADIHTLIDTQRTATRADVQSLIAARKQLQAQLDQASPDSAAVQEAATRVKELQAKLFDSRLQTQLAVRAKLSPDQWQQWRALQKGRGYQWARPGGFGAGAR